MSPRKTRRGAKSEGINDTLSETIAGKLTASPAEKQQKMRTRRQATKVSSFESDVEQSPQLNKSTRRTKITIQETPSKVTRSRKKALLDNTTIDETDTSVVVNTKTRRTRRGKENDSLVDQTVLLDGTTLDESSVKVNKSRGTRARKKNTKKAEAKSSDDEATTNRKINASAAKNVTIIESSSVDSITNDDVATISEEDIEVLQVSRRISRLKAATANSPSSPNGNRRSRNAKTRLEDFTPESSPLTVNLTPHRTTKTPRKSPMNLGSPKSHADAPLRLSKTPRKLPVVVDSPVPSELSVTSSTRSTPEKPARESKTPQKSPKSHKSPTNNALSPAKVVCLVRKFSKSPKIVLRSPKAKATRSKTPRVTASKVKRASLPKRTSKSPRRSKSPIKTPQSPRSTKKTVKPAASPKTPGGSPQSPRRSPKQLNKSPDSSPSSLMSLHLTRIDSPKLPRETSLASKPRASNVQSPTVILKKISPSRAQSPVALARSSSLRGMLVDESSKCTPAKSPSAEKRTSLGGESPHRAKSTAKKRSAVTDCGTPLRPIDTPRGAAEKLAAGKSIVISSSNPPTDGRRSKLVTGDESELMLSSTPRERIRRSLNLPPGLDVQSEIANSPVNGEAPAGCSTMIFEVRNRRRSFRIDDESNPLISDDDSFNVSPRSVAASRLDGTYEIEKDEDATIVVENEGNKSGNGTYELAEPKTPNLRRKAAKRGIGDLETSGDERNVKRTCRVRFASPATNKSDDRSSGTVIGRSRAATPRHRAADKRTAQITNGSDIFGANDSRNNDTINKARRRSNSMTNVSLLKTPVANKRRSNSVSDVNARSASRKAQNASVNRLSKPRLSISTIKKPENKTPVARKAPNFAQIHQKKFAQMESLVDAKKRVEKRHIAMSSKIPMNLSRVNSKAPTKPVVSAQPIGPIVAVNGAYNRYGFKLRKDDATKIVTQKQPPRTSQKKQNENRLLLKGVRTNRRFDLIMKARNINL